MNDTAVSFNQETDGTFRGLFTGAGTLTKLGKGSISLGGSQQHTGLTWVREGQLSIDGVLPGSVLVDPGASFRGAGIIGGSLNVSGSLLVPPPGSQLASFNSRFTDFEPASAIQAPSLVVNGNLTTTTGSTIGLSVSPGGAAPLIVNGTANLVGTSLTVNVNESQPREGGYLRGAFGGWRPAPVRGTNHRGIGDAGADVEGRTVQHHRHPAQSRRTARRRADLAQRRRCRPRRRCRQTAATGDFRNVVNELTALPDKQLDGALGSMAGEIHASTARLVALDGLAVTDMVRNELSSVEDDTIDAPNPTKDAWSPRFWIGASGARSTFTSGTFSGGTADVGGTGGGVDFRPGSKWTLGGGGALSVGGLSLTELSESSQMTAPRAFTYVGYRFLKFRMHGGGSIARTTSTTSRTMQFEAMVPDSNGLLVPLSGGVDRIATGEQVSTTSDAWSEWRYLGRSEELVVRREARCARCPGTRARSSARTARTPSRSTC